MKRKDIENWMKSKKFGNQIVILKKKEDKTGVYCQLYSNGLKDYTGHMVNRTLDIWGWIDFDGKGNATARSFDTTEYFPFMINGLVIKR